jgi:asparagine synthase (glutamine-hydrolysing)
VSAIVARVGSEPDAVDSAWLARATELSQAAGPDGHQHRQVARCGLGHAVLHTGVEVLGPITLDGRVWITADARLDARAELQTTLGAQDCPDAELILHAYRRWGERLVEHLAGDFAFAIWDDDAERLICARDQIGVSVLHYARVAGQLLIATSLDALVGHAAVSDALDEQAIADFIAFGYYTDLSATVFAAVRQLPPAHMLTWEAGEMRVRRYWTLPEWEPLARLPTLEDGAERLRDLLDTAVADRLTASRASTLLSGGMDSTSVTASALRALEARNAPAGALHAFTGVLGSGSGDREGDFARLVAEQLGVPIDVDDATTRSTIDPFAAPGVRQPEPLPYQFTDYLFRYVRVPARHAPVALSGHGADVLFQFVPWYFLEWLARGQVGRVTRAFAERVRLSQGRPRPHLRTILRVASYGRSAQPQLPPWLLSEFVARTGVADRQRERMPKPFGMRGKDIDARALSSDPMWAGLFRLGDPAFTREPVRVRHPFTDLRLIEFARSLAPEPWLVDKRVLREAAKSRLPEAVRTRPKTVLVQTPPSGVTEEALTSLAKMVKQTPELQRFADADLLAREVLRSGQDADVLRRWWRERALGLTYWLWHRREQS